MPNFTGPIQPVTGGATQENFQRMIDHVLLYLPTAPIPLIKRRINHHYRNLMDMRCWAGLMVRGEFYIPPVYQTGKIEAVPNQDYIVGTGTAWPTNDALNAELNGDIDYPHELQEVTLNGVGASHNLDKLEAGDWVIFKDKPTLIHEVLPYDSIAEQRTVICNPSDTYTAGDDVFRSSLTGRQFKEPTRKSYYTVRGIVGNRAYLDHPWSYRAGANLDYQFVQSYVTFPKGLKLVWSMANPIQGWQIRPHMPMGMLDRYDPWRSAQGWSFMLVDAAPDEIGRPRYELYPTPTVEQGIPYFAARIMPDLADDDDIPPTCIPSGVIVDNVLADLYLHSRKSDYYDPVASRDYRMQAEKNLIAAINQDDNIYMQNFTWDLSRYRYHGMSSAFMQAHDDYGLWQSSGED